MGGAAGGSSPGLRPGPEAKGGRRRVADERDRQESALRELYEQLLRTNARLAALVDASRSVAAEQDRGAALQLAAEALRGL